ncbi:glycosyltransferase family 1 protein [Paenibacillus sp. 2RAB27]|uniref:glycosyltransferase family 1 protein n=1 Tax=Paenibacillus sp. 2RAB27 TaxID=3232991 RepID=UPI003F9C6A47
MINVENKHRILHIVSAMKRGGAETLLMNVHRNLNTSKIQFDYVSHSSETCDYDDEISSLGGRIYRVPSLGQSGPLSYINHLKKIMSSQDYDAVHAHTDYQSGIVTLAAKMAGIQKRVCHSHSNNWGRGDGFKEKMILKTLRAIIKYSATDYCACSIDAARFLFGEVYTNKQRVRLLKNGIDINQFTQYTDTDYCVRQELGIAIGSKIIGHIGRFSESKNHQFLLRILKQMLEDGKDVVAVLVGDGPLMQLIEEESTRMGVYNQIRFLGVRSDIPRLMRAFDVFVFPSLFEGFGIVMLEAQGSGTPCIAADTVPKTTDLDLGLISFVSLNDPIEKWTKEIDKAFLKERPDDHQITSHFVRSGFDIKQNIQDWMVLYGLG